MYVKVFTCEEVDFHYCKLFITRNKIEIHRNKLKGSHEGLAITNMTPHPKVWMYFTMPSFQCKGGIFLWTKENSSSET